MSEHNEFYPVITNSKNIYFTSDKPTAKGKDDIFLSEWKGQRYLEAVSLSEAVNSEGYEYNAYVAPDESYLIFAGFDRDQNLGRSDLYISFNSDSNWSSPIWLGKEINSEGYDGSPFVSRDGKYLIFTSSRGSNDDDTYFNHYILAFDPSRFK